MQCKFSFKSSLCLIWLVGHLIRLVVLVSHLTAPTIDDSHQSCRNGLHHLPEHSLVPVHLLPASHNGSAELRFSPGLLALNSVLENCPNLWVMDGISKSKLRDFPLNTCSIGQTSLNFAAWTLWGILSANAEHASRAFLVLWMDAGSSYICKGQRNQSHCVIKSSPAIWRRH